MGQLPFLFTECKNTCCRKGKDGLIEAGKSLVYFSAVLENELN